MERRIFFWIEKLKITPAERKTVSGLVLLLVVLGITNMALSPSVPFARGHYRELEAQFSKRTKLLKKKRRKLMQRYHPSLNKQIPAARIDTITEDSTTAPKETHPDQNAQKVAINVNEAGKKALMSIPGIGPAYAGRIIEYRREHGGFETLEELKKIKGIGEKRLENLKPFIKLTDSKE